MKSNYFNWNNYCIIEICAKTQLFCTVEKDGNKFSLGDYIYKNVHTSSNFFW
jgi:hypothetical protein